MWRRSACLLLFLSPLLTRLGASAANPPGSYAIEEPRPFGHFIGDTLERRVTFDLPRDSEVLVPDVGAQPRRTGPWVELQTMHATGTTGAQGRRHRVTFHYQIVNSPPQPQLVTVPGPEVRIREGGAIRVERLPDWLLLVAPLTGDDVRQGLETHRPSRLPPLIDVTRSVVLAAGWSGAGLLLTGWLCFDRWGASWLRARRGPFGRARAGLLETTRQPGGPDRIPQALRLMHRAFDETAGHRLFAGRLQEFFAAHPEFADLQADIQAFYAASQADFFGPATGVEAPGPPARLLAVWQLNEQMRRRERPPRVSRAAVV